MKRIVIAVAVLLLGAAGARASQKIITFDRAYKGAIDRSIEEIGGKVTRHFRLIDAVAAQFPDDTKNASIYSLKGVSTVEEDSYIRWIESEPASMTANPLPAVETALSQIRGGVLPEVPAAGAFKADPAAEQKEIPWGVKRLNAPAAWDYNQGEGVKVAIIDTGMDYTHPDLRGNYKGGYNAIVSTASPMDDQGHGTHVSGTIGAVRDAAGVAGVAPKASLYAVKVLDKNGSGQYSWIIDGIEWAVTNHMDVINMSLGGGQGNEALKQVMQKAGEAGVTVVCAAGNDSGPVNYPAKYPQAIAVSASDNTDKIASFSSRGAEIAVIAPGVNIYSTRRGGGYTTMSGTSMASPHVAGLAALAVGAGAKTPDQVRKALTGAASKLPGLKPTDQGAGLVDAFKLVR